jgi:hypothetical protein
LISLRQDRPRLSARGSLTQCPLSGRTLNHCNNRKPTVTAPTEAAYWASRLLGTHRLHPVGQQSPLHGEFGESHPRLGIGVVGGDGRTLDRPRPVSFQPRCHALPLSPQSTKSGGADCCKSCLRIVAVTFGPASAWQPLPRVRP